MDLLKMVLDKSRTAPQVGQAAGLDSQAAESVIGKLLPALTQGLQNNLQQKGGLEALAGALQSGTHQRFIDDPASLDSEAAVEEGNGILGHVLGSKDASRQLASQVSAETGVDSGAIKKMLPMVAAMAMGALSKQTDGGKQLAGGNGLLGSLLGGGEGADAVSSVMGLARKLF